MRCNQIKIFFVFCIFFMACHLSLAKVSEESKYVDYFSKNKKKSAPNVNYGQLFIEENRRLKPTLVELSAFAGNGIGSMNVSWFYGGELRYKILSYFYIGLELTKYHSELPSSIRKILPELTVNGLEAGTSGLRNLSTHFNGHLHFFTSHVNLAGVVRINMSVPIQFGIGFTQVYSVSAKNTGLENINIKDRKVVPSLQWGIGPRVQFGRHFAIQVLLSQVHSLAKPLFRLHQVYGNIVVGI